MPVQISPSVAIVEKDLTNIATTVASTAGGFAGTFQWGPALEVHNISSEPMLVSTFGKPTTNSAVSFFTAANFLGYGSNLNVVRVVGPLAKNAVASGSAVVINNKSDYTQNYASGQGSVGAFAAKYPGALGNSLQVVLADANIFNGLYLGAVTVATPGTGYATAPTVAITGTGTGATAVAVLGSGSTAGQVVAINITSGGTGYTAAPTVTLAGGGFATAATATGALASTSGGWPYKSLFQSAPGTSTYAAGFNGSNDELHVVVIDALGFFTGVAGTVLETFGFLSKAVDATDYSRISLYYANYLSNASQYVYWMAHPAASTANFGTPAAGVTFGNLSSSVGVSLTGGVSDNILVDAIVQPGYAMFTNAEAIDVSLIPLGGASVVTANYVIQNVVLKRLDCMAFVSPLLSDVVNNSGLEATAILATRATLPSTSYAVMDSGWKYQYDRYNNVYRWIPLNGDVAGLCARTDQTNDAWWSPAGLNRGQINNVVKLAYSPTQADRDVLYPLGINPVINIVGNGTVLLGDKTLLSKPSAFDRINVRRLFMVLEKTIATASKYYLFEFNDALTRSQFVATIKPFLSHVKGLRGITDFKIVCDSTNNTQQVIDSNSLVGSIFIKPVRSINFLQLSFVAVSSGVSFTSVAGV